MTRCRMLLACYQFWRLNKQQFWFRLPLHTSVMHWMCHLLGVQSATTHLSPAWWKQIKSRSLCFRLDLKFFLTGWFVLGRRPFSSTALFTFFDNPLAGLFSFFTVLINLITGPWRPHFLFFSANSGLLFISPWDAIPDYHQFGFIHPSTSSTELYWEILFEFNHVFGRNSHKFCRYLKSSSVWTPSLNRSRGPVGLSGSQTSSQSLVNWRRPSVDRGRGKWSF